MELALKAPGSHAPDVRPAVRGLAWQASCPNSVGPLVVAAEALASVQACSIFDGPIQHGSNRSSRPRRSAGGSRSPLAGRKFGKPQQSSSSWHKGWALPDVHDKEAGSCYRPCKAVPESVPRRMLCLWRQRQDWLLQVPHKCFSYVRASSPRTWDRGKRPGAGRPMRPHGFSRPRAPDRVRSRPRKGRGAAAFRLCCQGRSGPNRAVRGSSSR